MALPVVVYQGEPGAYSEAAARQLLGTNIKSVGLDSFEKCFEALDLDRADFAMMPIENSMGGSIHDCFDLQAKYDFNIVAELDFRVKHCLLAMKGVTKSDIKMVISHPQALAQCEQYLKKNGLQCRREYDTAGSAKKIYEEKLNDHAAIASELAATVHNLVVLEKDIEDDPNNVTRFFLLSKHSLIPPSTFDLLREAELDISYKTSIVLSFVNVPGALCRALSFFAKNGLDLSKLESRPNKIQKKGRFLPNTLPHEILELFSDLKSNLDDFDLKDENDYPFVFYLDILGSISEHKVLFALKQVASFCVFFRILGSFPRKGVLQQFVAQAVHVPNNTVISPKSLENDIVNMNQRPSYRLKIAIVGFGNFGQFLAKTFVVHHNVVACNRSDERLQALKLGVPFYRDPVSMLEAESDVDIVVFAVSILAFETVLKSIPLELLRNKLLVDVLSVKTFPKTLLSEVASKAENATVLCTHPMFGPESGKYSWKSLPMMFEKLYQAPNSKADAFLKLFEDEGCRMVEMSCEDHDGVAANSQFITHFLGRSIDRLGLSLEKDKSREIATAGFKSLLNIRDQTVKDSADLFAALYIYNENSEKTVGNFTSAIASVFDDLKQRKSRVPSLSKPTKDKEVLFAPSKAVQRIATSATAAVFGLATKLRSEGKEIVMSLCVGEPDYLPPKAVLDAAKKAIDDGRVRYTTVNGLPELRKGITDDLKRRKDVEYTPEQILITPSAKQGLYLAFQCLIDEGDEVIIAAPYWPSYPELVKSAGGVPVIVERSPAKDFDLDPVLFENAITSKTKFFLLCNPDNPTGCFYDRAQSEAIAQILRKPKNSHVKVLADEIYERLVFDGKSHVSFAALDGMKDRVVLINGFSKGHAMTGFRLGYLAAVPEVISYCSKLQSQINTCANTISQYAGVAALKVPDDELTPLYQGLEMKRDLICKRLAEIDHVIVPKVAGAFYVFPDVSYYIGEHVKSKVTGEIISTSTVLGMYLIEKFGIAVTPGDAFGAPYGLRLSFATSEEEIEKAVDRIRNGLYSLSVDLK